MVDNDELDDDEIKSCALDTVLALLRDNDLAVESAWHTAVADCYTLRALEESLSDPEPHA